MSAHVYMQARLYVCVHVCVCVCLSVSMCVCACARMCMHTSAWSVCACVCVHVCARVYSLSLHLLTIERATLATRHSHNDIRTCTFQPQEVSLSKETNNGIEY